MRWNSKQLGDCCCLAESLTLFLSLQFYGYIFPKLELVNMKADFLNRNVNEGFSGGERKRNEILQLAVRIFFYFIFHLVSYYPDY